MEVGRKGVTVWEGECLSIIWKIFMGGILRVERACPSLRKLEFNPESSGPYPTMSKNVNPN